LGGRGLVAQAPPAGAGGRGSGGRGAVSVWAVVPAYNEEERVGLTVEALYRSVGCRRVIVVDDGSTDGTAERASRAGATVLRQGRNSGKGQALRRGSEEVVAGEDRALEAVLLADADLGPSAGGLGPLVEAVRGGGVLAVAGSLPAGGLRASSRRGEASARWWRRREAAPTWPSPPFRRRVVSASPSAWPPGASGPLPAVRLKARSRASGPFRRGRFPSRPVSPGAGAW